MKKVCNTTSGDWIDTESPVKVLKHTFYIFFIQAGTDAKFQPTTLILQFHKKTLKNLRFRPLITIFEMPILIKRPERQNENSSLFF